MHTLIYVGTYTRTNPQGPDRAESIFRFRLDLETGSLTSLAPVTGLVNPSFLAWHPSGRYLYAVNEVDESGSKHGGTVTAFAVDPVTGDLALLNRQPTGERNPCHLALDATGRYLVATNYSGGTVVVLPVGPDGRLAPASEVLHHHGHSVNPERQEAPHPHSSLLVNDLVFVADLGLDRVMLYRLDMSTGHLSAHKPAWITCRPGAGPRHMALHPDGRTLYVANELDSTVSVFACAEGYSAFSEVQTVRSVPADFQGTNYPAHICLAPAAPAAGLTPPLNLYASNRGHDSLMVCAVAEDSRLAALGYPAAGGNWPRHFALDPTATFVIVGHQYDNTLSLFRRGEAQSAEWEKLATLAVPAPVCFIFTPPV